MASVSGDTDPPTDGLAGPAAVVAGAAPEGEDDCGAVAVCGAGVEPVPVDVRLPEGEPVAVGELALLTSVVTVALDAGFAAGAVVGVVVVGAGMLACCSVASDGFELPLPLGGAVVVGAGAAVLLVVAGAAVVGGVVVATVVAGALLAAVPWVPVAPADWEVGAA